MAQDIHFNEYQSGYPFGLNYQPYTTYVQITKQLQSQSQLQTYYRNLTLFHQINSELIIKLHSFLNQGKQIQIYYQYEPLSLKTLIEQKVFLIIEQENKKDNFLTNVIEGINLSVSKLIQLLISKKIMTLLSIDNIAITDNGEIKFYIEPNFDYNTNATQLQFFQFYQTEKVKLKLQVQEFIEQIFSLLSIKTKNFLNQKANFVIQGNKLLFASNQDQNKNRVERKNSLIESSHRNLIFLSQNQSSSSPKFDIKSILDKKKMQKNQTMFNNPPSNNYKSQHTSSNTYYEQKMNRNQTFENFNRSSNEVEQVRKQIKNYFQNNDNFNKDTSFYPEQFTKQESIAEISKFVDELQKQLEDLMNKKYRQENQNDQFQNHKNIVQIAQTNSMEQKKKKYSIYSQSKHHSQIFHSRKNPLQLNSLESIESKAEKSKIKQNNQQSQNQNKSQESSSQERKKKYLVTITTSHQVDVQNGNVVNLDQIQKQITKEIQKGSFKPGESIKINQIQSQKRLVPKESLNQNFLPDSIRRLQTHNPTSLQEKHQNIVSEPYRRTYLNNIIPISRESLYQKFQVNNVFYKQNQINHFANDIQKPNSMLSINLTKNFTAPHSSQDVKRIIQKIKNNFQNKQTVSSTINKPLNPCSQFSFINKSQNQFEPSSQKNTNFFNIVKPSDNQLLQSFEQEVDLQSKIKDKELNQANKDNMQERATLNDREYQKKLQKAKKKALEIMKIIKEKKVQ